MADQTRTFLVLLQGDNSSLVKASQGGAAALKGASDGADEFVRAQQAQQASTKLTAYQTQQLTYQLNDFFVQVASGSSPLTALIQQGSQLTGTFGGVRGAVGAVLSLFTPLRIAVGGAAAILGVLGVAAYEGAQQLAALQKVEQLSGNIAGATADSFDASAKSIERFGGGTITQARAAFLSLVQSGQVTETAIDSVGAAVVRMANSTGESVDGVAKDWVGMTSDVAAGAAKLNRQYNFLTAAQYDYIRALQAEGQTQQALKYTADKYNEAKSKQISNLGTIERLLQSGKKAWSDWWDSALALGREPTIAERVAQAQQLADLASKSVLDPNDTGAYFGRPRASDASRRDNAQEILRLAKQSQGAQADSAAAAAAAAEKNQQEILQRSADYQAALTAIAMAGSEQRLAFAQASAAKELDALDQSYATANISIAGYAKARFAIESQEIRAEMALVDDQIAQEKKRQPDGQADSLQQRARLLALDTQRFNVQQKLVQLQVQYRKGELIPGDLRTSEAPTAAQQFSAFEHAQSAAAEQGILERSAAAAQAYTDLIDQNKQTSAALILDDQTRGQAQIALDTETLRKRLELETLSAQDRQAAESALADYVALRNQQLTEQLKPEWQKQLDGWKDTVKLMRDASDEFMQGFIDQGRDMWVEFGKTGKLSVTSLLDFVRTEFLKLTYNQLIAPAAASFGQSLFGAITGSLGSLLGGGSGLSIDPSGAGLTAGGPSLVELGLGGGRAGGGGVDPYTTYLVGEEGPELLRMGGRGGTVIPNKAIGGGDMHLTIAPVFNGGVSRNELVNGMNLATDAAVARIRDARRRGDRTVG
jgi:phage-related minor tail protein